MILKMRTRKKYSVLIVGGGLAGLVSAICLSRAGLSVLLVEKKEYPFHRVCGEYVSNEVLPFLQRIGANPQELNPPAISRLMVTSPGGSLLKADLPMGGFGLSRYSFDDFLFKKASEYGVEFITGRKVSQAVFAGDEFNISLEDGQAFSAEIVIGAFGKRSGLDRSLARGFFFRRSPYVAVKYHIRTVFPDGYIGLHNFRDGYCGISAVENDRHCLCYMTTRERLRQAGSIPELEHSVLMKNPYLKEIFRSSELLYEKPEVINEISFEKKEPVFNHILMTGDSAGMIAPLCGNGMAMAINSARILSELIIRYNKGEIPGREELEAEYTRQWNAMFSARLSFGRNLQKLFGNEILTDITVRLLAKTPGFTRWLIRQTHGEEIT